MLWKIWANYFSEENSSKLLSLTVNFLKAENLSLVFLFISSEYVLLIVQHHRRVNVLLIYDICLT